MQIEYKGTKIQTSDDVYEPSEDTFLLLEALDSIGLKETESVLEIGTGTGIIAIHMARHATSVTAVDINPHATECARKNAKANGIKNIEIKESDLFENVGKKYDLIIFNPPYLPEEKKDTKKDIIECSWDSGKSGRNTTDRFLKDAPLHLKDKGRIIIVGSSRSRYKKTVDALKKKGFAVSIIGRLNLFFEELAVIHAENKSII